MDRPGSDAASITDTADVLEQFLHNFLNRAPVLAHVDAACPMWRVEDITSVLMYRVGQFQVQMFITPPNYVIPAHTHPNVDSYEVFMGGQMKFSHDGKFVVDTIADQRVDGFGSSVHRGAHIRVKPNDRHGGVTGPAGAVFLSVQHWLNNVPPSCVANDYNGRVMGPDHLAKVTTGVPESAQQYELKEEDTL